MKAKKNKKNRKKLKVTLLVVEVFLIVISLVVGGTGIYYTTASAAKKIQIRNDLVKSLSKWSITRDWFLASEKKDYEKNVKDENYKQDDIKVDKVVKKKLTGYTNIALFGIDAREDEFDDSTNSDSIIVVSINNDTGEVKLVSVYRDTMMKIRKKDGEAIYTKANEAFFRGGAEGAVNMLNTNLDLNITDYVTVNFSGLAEIIDAFGGVDVTLTDDEQFYVNGYLVETRKVTGMQSEDVPTSGAVHLNGLQATAYCRIRYTSYFDETGKEYKDDLGRTARQRHVLSLLVDKAKAAGSDKIMTIAKRILRSNTKNKTFIKTSMEFDEIMDLIPIMIDFTLTDTVGFPYTIDMPTIDKKSYVVAEGMSYNVSKLHEFIFGEKDYQVSETVERINDYIMDFTGVEEVTRKEDNPDYVEETTSLEEVTEQMTEQSGE